MKIQPAHLHKAITQLYTPMFKRGMKNNDRQRSHPHDYAFYILAQAMPRAGNNAIAFSTFDAEGHQTTRVVPVDCDPGEAFPPFFNLWLYMYPLRETVKLADKNAPICLSIVDDPETPAVEFSLSQPGWKTTIGAISGYTLPIPDMLAAPYDDGHPDSRTFAAYQVALARADKTRAFVQDVNRRGRRDQRRKARRQHWQRQPVTITPAMLNLPKRMQYIPTAA